MTRATYKMQDPPWSSAAGGTGNSDDYGDEQDRAEWFEHEAERLAAVAADYAAEAFHREAGMQAAWSALDRNDILSAYDALDDWGDPVPQED